jgi:hypothetical protein
MTEKKLFFNFTTFITDIRIKASKLNGNKLGIIFLFFNNNNTAFAVVLERPSYSMFQGFR